MKIITICGSLKFKNEIMESAFKLELEGNICIVPVFLDNRDKDSYQKQELNILGKIHKEKIKISDTIFVVDKDNYIGESTRSEIEYAKSLNKEIIYYSKYIF